MNQSSSSYGSVFRNIARDMMLPYKHFGHWTLSKVTIYVSAFLLAFLCSLPILIGLIFEARSIWVEIDRQSLASFLSDGSTMNVLQWVLFSHAFGIILSVLGALVMIAILTFFLSYASFLVSNVARSYLKETPLPVRKNLYFKTKFIQKFLAVISWVSWYVGIPVFIGIAIVLVLWILQISGNVSITALSTYTTGIVTLIGAIILGFSFVKRVISYMFAPFFLLRDGPVRTGKAFAQLSVRFTHKRRMRVFLLMIPFVLVLGLVQTGIDSVQSSWAFNRALTGFESIRATQGKEFIDDHRLIIQYITPFSLNLPVVAAIEKEFTPRMDAIDEEYLRAMLPYLDTSEVDPTSSLYSLIFQIVSFLLIGGLTSMLMASLFVQLGGEDFEAEGFSKKA